MKLTKQKRSALLKVIEAKIALWDACTDAEGVLGVEINTSGEMFDYMMSSIDHPSQIKDLSNKFLIAAFELE